MKRFGIALILAGGVSWVALTPAWSDGLWTTDGLPLAPVANDFQTFCSAAGRTVTGQVLYSFSDFRGFSQDIYAQLTDGTGNQLWGPSGQPVCTQNNDQYNPLIIDDGAGGAMVAWTDFRNGPGISDIFAQRLNGGGGRSWAPATGVPVCVTSGAKSLRTIVSDGAGGAFFVWDDSRAGGFNNSDVYVQRLNAAGTAMWAANGIPAVSLPGNQMYSTAVSDGAGGVIIAWADATGSNRIYAQRIDAGGNTLLSVNGLAISLNSTSQSSPVLARDGAGGVIALWGDGRNGDFDLYAQRLNGAGAVQWNPADITVCAATGMRNNYKIAEDGAGGALAVWEDQRSGIAKIYAQHINAAGTPLWSAGGAPVCPFASSQTKASIVPDGAGGALILWEDARSASPDIYSQRLSAAGTPLWDGNGIPLCTESHQQTAAAGVSDRAGGLVAVWYDYRPAPYEWVYAQRILKPWPRIAGLSPLQAPRGQVLSGLIVSGQAFSDDRGQVTYVKLTRAAQPDIVGTLRPGMTGTNFTCDFDLTTAAVGTWYFVACDSLGQTSTPASLFTIYAPQAQSLEWISVPAGDLNTGTQTNLVGQINLYVAGFDSLTALQAENLGTASSGTDLAKLSLWYNAAGRSSGLTFSPGTAQRLGDFAPTANPLVWSASCNQAVADGSALYLTADIAGGAVVGDTLRFSTPAGAAVFQSGNTLPAIPIFSATEQRIAFGISAREDLVPSGAVNVLQGQTNVRLGQISVTNVTGGAITLRSLRFDSRAGTGLAGDLGRIFQNVRLDYQGSPVASLTAPVTGNLFTLTTPLALPSQGQAVFTVTGDLLPAPAWDAFQLGLTDGLNLNQGAYLAEPLTGKTFPLWLPLIKIRQPTLASSFGAYPNPFQAPGGSAKISYALKSPAHVKISVYTLARSLVKTVMDDDVPAGLQETAWDGRNDRNNVVRNGVYLMVIEVTYADGAKDRLERKVGVVK